MVFVGYGLSVQVNTGKNGNGISLILEYYVSVLFEILASQEF
jgi:hypothetical protein